MNNEFFGSVKTLFQIHMLHGKEIYEAKATQGKHARSWKIP